MTGEQQKHSVASFSEYLNEEGVCHVLLAYRSDGDLTFAINSNEDLPSALSFVALRDEEFLNAMAIALGMCAKEKGHVIHINNRKNEN